jgi:hypothetical protein
LLPELANLNFGNTHKADLNVEAAPEGVNLFRSVVSTGERHRASLGLDAATGRVKAEGLAATHLPALSSAAKYWAPCEGRGYTNSVKQAGNLIQGRYILVTEAGPVG